MLDCHDLNNNKMMLTDVGLIAEMRAPTLSFLQIQWDVNNGMISIEGTSRSGGVVLFAMFEIFFLFGPLPSSEETSFLTTFYGLYF